MYFSQVHHAFYHLETQTAVRPAEPIDTTLHMCDAQSNTKGLVMSTDAAARHVHAGTHVVYSHDRQILGNHMDVLGSPWVAPPKDHRIPRFPAGFRDKQH